MIKQAHKLLFIFLIGATIGSAPLWQPVAHAADGNPLKLSWKVNVGDGKILLIPVLVDNKVLVVSPKNDLVALDAKTGETKWKYAPAEGVWKRGIKADNNQVFACLKGGIVTALNAQDGTEQWRVNLGINCPRPAHVTKDSVYVSTTFVGAGLPGKPLTGAKFFSIDRASGKINWQFTSKNYLIQTATSFGDTVYAAGSYIDPNFDDDEGGANRFQAIDIKTGKVKWTHESVDGFPKTIYATKTELVYIAYQDYAYGLDAKTGERIWERNTSNWVPGLTGKDNRVYMGAANTDVYAFATDTGKRQWRYNIPGGTFNYILQTPAVDDDRLYFITQKGHIYAINRHKGEELWMHNTGEIIRIGISVKDGVIYTGDIKGNMYAYKILK